MNERSKKLEKQMTSERYEHTQGVMYTAAALAMRYGIDMNKALLAGLLHDCAKIEKYPPEKMIAACEKFHVPINEYERKHPSLLHAKLGAYIAEKKHDVHDTEILDAISYHTTGRPKMSLLEKIIYIADYIEPGRKEASNLSRVRKLAFVDLDECLLRILEDTLIFLKKKDCVIDPMTIKTYKYYKKLLKK